jgi:hypothetical protein
VAKTEFSAGCDINRMVKEMNTNEAEVIDEFEEILNFLKDVCSRYHLENRTGQFDQFISWVVVEAGILYIKHALQPESAQC